MTKYRSYWVYSLGCFVVWAVLLAVVAAKGNNRTTHNFLLVFGGWVIAWLSGAVARLVYPPPERWLQADAGTP
jgi:hypothetical protein